MTETLIIIAALLLVAYFVEDGRIRVAIISALGAFAFWRNYSNSSSSSNSEISNEPILPNTEVLDAEIADTDVRLDAIDDARPSGSVGAALELLDEHDRHADRK
jgi:hypothetical protein